jgi:two-component system, sensor histidine kinase PdtaS
VEDAVLSLDTLVPCTLIVHELVSNALKHGFADGRTGTIAIALHPVASQERTAAAASSVPEPGDRQFKLEVRDNGSGLPENVDFRNAPTLGLQLVSALADQLEAALEVSRAGGTTVALRFQDVRYQAR